MPEVHFEVRWPDDERMRYYSPSRAVRAQLAAGESYPVPEFLERIAAAMEAASARFEAKYGYRCSSAADTLQRIRIYAEALPEPQRKSGTVTIEHMDDP